MNKTLAGFIITYERPDILLMTIDRIFSQTLPPSKLLVVDNSYADNARSVLAKMGDSRLEYYFVGHNSGPAGAAKIALKRLADEGFQWIYWGDDDDPPEFEDTFERLLSVINQDTKKIGIIGAVGHYFNRQTGNIQRMPNVELFHASAHDMNFISVDSIAGNQSMIINSQIVRAGVLPDEDLFFGFEELDFCLKTKNAGFDLYVSVSLFLRSREKHNRLNYKRPAYIKKSPGDIRREYYSARNMLLILKFNRLLSAYLYQLLKGFLKMLYGFRFGSRYGKTNFEMIGMGLYHGMLNITGRRR